jgi:hypothetical protein
MVYAAALKAVAREGMWVRVPPRAQLRRQLQRYPPQDRTARRPGAVRRVRHPHRDVPLDPIYLQQRTGPRPPPPLVRPGSERGEVRGVTPAAALRRSRRANRCSDDRRQRLVHRTPPLSSDTHNMSRKKDRRQGGADMSGRTRSVALWPAIPTCVRRRPTRARGNGRMGRSRGRVSRSMLASSS